jgi:hypothetical protein
MTAKISATKTAPLVSAAITPWAGASTINSPVATLELVLMNGARRIIEVPAGSGTMANALARLDDWIQTVDGGWVQKSHIVEVRPADAKAGEAAAGTDTEYSALSAAADRLATEAQDEQSPRNA